MKPEFNDSPALKAHFKLIVAIICAGLTLRYSLMPTKGWLVIVIPALLWLVFRATRDLRL